MSRITRWCGVWAFNNDVNGLVQSQTVVRSRVNESFDIASAHQLSHHVGLVLFLAQVEHGHDVRVGAQTPHGLSLSLDAGAGGVVQALGLYQGKSNLPV